MPSSYATWSAWCWQLYDQLTAGSNPLWHAVSSTGRKGPVEENNSILSEKELVHDPYWLRREEHRHHSPLLCMIDHATISFHSWVCPCMSGPRRVCLDWYSDAPWSTFCRWASMFAECSASCSSARSCKAQRQSDIQYPHPQPHRSININ